MNDTQDMQDRDELQHYLRTLRKKVEHQLKNPFELAFANFHFEELATWKNNVLQLDATSRLYGQRVDFLHCGAMQILGSVLTNDGRQAVSAQKQEIKKQQAYDNNPHERNLQQPERLNSEIVKAKTNILLWREVCKKRDALHQLMLNDLTTDRDLRVTFFPSEEKPSNENVLQQQPLVYLKLLDFRHLSTKFLSIYKQMEQAISESNIFLINLNDKQKERGENIKIQSCMEFDFQEFEEFPPLELKPFDLQEQFNLKEAEFQPMQASQFHHSDNDDNSDDSYELDESQDYFQFENWNKNDNNKSKSKRQRKTRAKEGNSIEKRQEMISFKGINPTRKQVLMQSTGDDSQEKFILSPDYLLLRFVRYSHPFPKKPKKTTNLNLKPIVYPVFVDATTFESDFTPNVDNDSSCPFYPMTSNISQFSRQKFKQAALPIKQMKKKIKQRVSKADQKSLIFHQIKAFFAQEQPLDIFISLLHVAAQEQVMISI